MKNQITALFTICCLFQTSSFAGEQAPGESQNVRFEDLKVACANPNRFHNQVAPSNIQISCADIKTKWVADPQGSVALPTKRVVITSVISNKYSVSPSAAEVASDPQSAACEQYKQVIENVEVVHTASCDELMTFQGRGEEFCAIAIDALRIDNPTAIKTQDTGKKASFCEFKTQD